MKNSDDKQNWDFDPSNDDDFMKTIEQVLMEEEQEQQQKININNNDDIQWIDISEELKSKENIEFSVFEKAVHNIGNMDELYEEDRAVSDKKNEVDAIVDEITDSLSKQVDISFQTNEPPVVTNSKNKLWKRILIPVTSVLATLLLIFVFLGFTKPGRSLLIKLGANYVSGVMDYEDGSSQEVVFVPDITDDPKDIANLPVMKEDDILLDTDDGTARHEDYAVNILLLGEEAIESGMARGRTDVMMIATLNKKEKSLKLTSLMRDMYVQIPGHLDNKLNSAYATGGIPLLYETIELNFNIKLDGYCLVGFNNFEKIIDMLDGIDIELTSSEANYLNTTNYISNPANRTVTTGWNHMNGNQALGYCRIRKVPTLNKENNDFGRTSRNRIVLDSIFNKYKTLGLWDLAIVANSCLPMITTDLDASEIEAYLSMALEIGLNKLEQSRIPADGAFEDVTVREMRVIVPNLQKNIEIMHTFIFGDSK